MNTLYIIGLVAFGLTVSWILADAIIPQSEIDKIEAIGRWAKEELDRRERKRNDQCR